MYQPTSRHRHDKKEETPHVTPSCGAPGFFAPCTTLNRSRSLPLSSIRSMLPSRAVWNRTFLLFTNRTFSFCADTIPGCVDLPGGGA